MSGWQTGPEFNSFQGMRLRPIQRRGGSGRADLGTAYPAYQAPRRKRLLPFFLLCAIVLLIAFIIAYLKSD
jgi:hypothetical protein